jgi:hypothetical protein
VHGQESDQQFGSIRPGRENRPGEKGAGQDQELVVQPEVGKEGLEFRIHARFRKRAGWYAFIAISKYNVLMLYFVIAGILGFHLESNSTSR